MDDVPAGEWVTLMQASWLLKISLTTIYRRARNGDLVARQEANGRRVRWLVWIGADDGPVVDANDPPDAPHS